MDKKLVQALIDKWPSAVVARTEIKQFTGGAISTGYLSNLDCKGEGIPGKFYVGKKVVYPVEEVAKWLLSKNIKKEVKHG